MQPEELEIVRTLRNKDTQAAIFGAFTLINFGLGLQQSQGTMVLFFEGGNITRQGLINLNEILDHADLTDAELSKLAADLSGLETSEISRDLANSLRAQYQDTLVSLERAEREGVSLADLDGPSNSSKLSRVVGSFQFKKNRTTLLFADFYRHEILQTEKRRINYIGYDFEQVERDSKKRWRLFFQRNQVGHGLFLVGAPFFSFLTNQAEFVKASHQLLRTRVAMERYKLHHGIWPHDLNALMPEYIDDVPLDPIDGKPIRYNLDNSTIYSIGIDLKDGGGKGSGETRSLSWLNEIEIWLGDNQKTKPSATVP